MKKTAKKLLGERIKEIRKNKGQTQEKLSEQLGITPQYLCRVEAGKTYPSLECLENMAKALNVGLSDFFNFRHLQEGSTEPDFIKKMLEGVDAKKRKMIVKVINAIIR